jgi:hypothetical protein
MERPLSSWDLLGDVLHVISSFPRGVAHSDSETALQPEEKISSRLSGSKSCMHLWL